MHEREQRQHRKVGVVLTGANVDLEVFHEVMSEQRSMKRELDPS